MYGIVVSLDRLELLIEWSSQIILRLLRQQLRGASRLLRQLFLFISFLIHDNWWRLLIKIGVRLNVWTLINYVLTDNFYFWCLKILFLINGVSLIDSRLIVGICTIKQLNLLNLLYLPMLQLHRLYFLYFFYFLCFPICIYILYLVELLELLSFVFILYFAVFLFDIQ